MNKNWPFLLLLLCFSFFPSFADETESGEEPALIVVASPSDTSESEGADWGYDLDEVDSLFMNAEDRDEAVITEEEKSGTDYNVQLGTIKFPIEVTGSMNTEFGGAFIRQSMINDATIYFDFKNYVYFTTRPDKYLALKGVVKTSMPKDSSDSESNHLLYLYEMYFDYLMFNRLYITAGKKKSVWGNIRLFSSYYDDKSDDSDNKSNDSDDNVNDAQFTNILYDSRDYISGILKLPVGNHTFTALAMYNEESSKTSPGTKDMSLAASAEFILFGTSLNFFGRRFPLRYGADSANFQLPIVGMEMKRTIFGFDIYGQSMGRVLRSDDGYKVFSSKLKDFKCFNRVISTAGIYRLWTGSTPYVGFNFEWQSIFRPEVDENESHFTNRLAFEFGMAKLGPEKNIKIATQWNHNISDKTGFVKSGIIFSRVMPHCDWRNGIKYEYGKEAVTFNKYKLTAGTYLTINLDY